jgi:hypothetical protein
MLFDPAARREITNVANQHKIEPARLMAIAWVESAGKPFWVVDGQNKAPIRFEGHFFYQRLADPKRGDPAKLKRAVREGLANPRAGAVKNPNSYAGRYALLARAMAIDPDMALESTSVGLGQVMGAWWKDLGYGSVQELWRQAQSGIAGQVELMYRYLAKYHLLAALAAGDWKKVAEGYNGPGYAKNAYDKQLADAYRGFRDGTAESRADVAATAKLASLGYKPDHFADTTDAVSSFQAERGLTVDGDLGPMTAAELDTAVAEQKQAKAPARVGLVTGGVVAAAVPTGKAALQVVDALDRGAGAASSAQSIMDAIGVPVVIAGIVVAIVVGGVMFLLVRRALTPAPRMVTL